MIKIGLLIPTTINKRNYEKMMDIDLYKLFLDTFISTYDDEHKYTIYLGVDEDDNFFIDKDLENLVKNIKNVSIKVIRFEDIKKGHLTKMWNVLFDKAYDDTCDYFYQCGDDISFKNKGWVNKSIATLQLNNNIGVTGPINTNGNTKILTQSFVSRKHMEIFGYYFPTEIINWYCDDWINDVYSPDHIFKLNNYTLLNLGGEQRYIISKPINYDDIVKNSKHILYTTLSIKMIRFKKEHLTKM